MRALIAIGLSSTLLVSSALAAEVTPLAPGKPAGIKHAQMEMSTTTWVLLGVGAVTAIAIGVASSSNGGPLQPNPPLAVTTATV